MPMDKKLWAGVVAGQISFFASDPQGNVEGLEGSRTFYVKNNNIVDHNGASLIDNTATGGGANTQDVAEQTSGGPQTT